MNIAAFFSYVLLSTYTPGPNNIMAMSNASKHGFVKGLRFNIGVFCGWLVLMTLCCAFTALLFGVIPKIEPYMRVVGAVYILWLAWCVWRDKPHEGKRRAMETNSVLTGALLQFVNVKVILFGITVMSTFLLPNVHSVPALLGCIVLLCLVGFSSTCCWALFGALFSRVFEAHRKGLNLVMALLLVYCAVSLFL